MLAKYTLRTKREENLVRLAQEGDINSMQILVQKYYPMAVKITSKYFAVGAEKEDLIQSGLFGVIKATLYYKPGKSSFSSFVWTCIEGEIQTFVSFCNRKKHEVLSDSISMDYVVEGNDDDVPISDTMSSGEDLSGEVLIDIMIERFLKEAKEILTKREYDIYALFINGYTYKEIARRTNATRKAVDNSIQRAKKKLRGIIDKYKNYLVSGRRYDLSAW
ncbi:MAG: RNA polymerase subunit sigma-70 [Thermotoga sp.]|nr:MAG: RNA polymerase subunit sigma-70 [Thermotoga sp.]